MIIVLGWHDLKDWWGAKLWHIEPYCQVAGTVDDEAIALDGALGAATKWHCLNPVPTFTRPRLIRKSGKTLLRGAPLYLFTGITFVLVGASTSKTYDGSGNSSAMTMLVFGSPFLLLGAIRFFAAPALLFDMYHGKSWSRQAMFYGTEGVVDVGTVEEYLFGFDHGRIKRSTSGSTPSRHVDKDGECMPAAPSIAKSDDVAKADVAQPLFTLVDTYTLTAYCFYAQRPPTAVIVCGKEGGTQRAMLCSYDWRPSTFCRETVLRMDTMILDRIFRVRKFRFALRRLSDGKKMAPAAGETGVDASSSERLNS